MIKKILVLALSAVAFCASAQSIPASSADSGSRAVVAITPMSSSEVTNIVQQRLRTGEITVPIQGLTPWTMKFAGRSWPNTTFPIGKTYLKNLTFNSDGSLSAQNSANQWAVIFRPTFSTGNDQINLSVCIPRTGSGGGSDYGSLFLLTPTGNIQTGTVTGWMLQVGRNTVGCSVNPSSTFYG